MWTTMSSQEALVGVCIEKRAKRRKLWKHWKNKGKKNKKEMNERQQIDLVIKNQFSTPVEIALHLSMCSSGNLLVFCGFHLRTIIN